MLPEQRRHGVGGKLLLVHIARPPSSAAYTRIGWAALDWNELALGFYRKLGADVLDEWTDAPAERPDALRARRRER